MKEVAVDHIVAVGTLRDWDDIGGFCERLFVEEDALQLLCTSCHQTKTNRKF